MLERFDLASLSKLDNGRIHAAFEHALKRCEGDCRDRPSLKKARTVSLEVTMLPVIDVDSSELESVDIQLRIVDKQPKRESRAYNMRAERDGLYWNELSPGNAAQGTLDQSAGGPKAKLEGGAVHAG